LRRSAFRIAAACICVLIGAASARADDGFDLPFVSAVRAATDGYRLLLWAQSDGFIQSTDYVPGVGVMYTNHGWFNPPDLAHPTVLIFDQAGRLVACEYQFESGSAPSSAFAAVPADAWFDIPRHVHYNIEVDGKTYYAQAEWAGSDQPTADALLKRGLMPSNGKLLFAFIHPKTKALIVWAWLPNADGPFAGANALLP
jgi:hypothetical protein